MNQSSDTAARHHRAIPHLIAGALALLYAWNLSGTRFVTTGLQFVAPVAVILLAHLAWFAAKHQLAPGFAHTAFARTAITAIGISAFSFLLDIIAPMPAGAANGIETIAMAVACFLVLALVVGVIALVIYAISKGIRAAYRAIRGPKDPGGGKLYDFGAMALALGVIGTASLEGVIPALTLSAKGRATSTVIESTVPE